MKVHIYARVSVSKGNTYAENTLDTQTEECRDHCRERGWADDQLIFHVHTRSARSGGNLPELREILKIMNAGDVLIVYSIDRLSRHTREGIEFLEDVYKKGCRIESVHEKLTYDKNNIYDRYKIRDILNHAELESDRLSVRTKRAWTSRKKSPQTDGPPLSSTRFQCRKRRRSEVDVESIDQSTSQYTSLVDHMNVDGVATRSMVNRVKRRRVRDYQNDYQNNYQNDYPDADPVIVINTRETGQNMSDQRIGRNSLLKGTLKRYIEKK